MIGTQFLAYQQASPPLPQGDDARVRASVSGTVGSLLEGTDAPAFEQSISLAHFEHVTLPEGALYEFREALTPGRVETLFYTLPATSSERLSEHVGSTKLGRMTEVYPPAVVGTAVELVGKEVLTAQELLQVLFDRWAAAFAWFSAKRVPDLRYRVPDGDYSGSRGVVTVEAVWLPQGRDDTPRLSMREIIDEVLALFPGTVLVQDAEGEIALRPVYGPDAPVAPVVRLSNEDVVSITTGRADSRGVRNRARVESSAREFVGNTAVAPPAWTRLAHFDEAALPARSEDQEIEPYYTRAFDENLIVSAEEPVTVEYTHTIWSATSSSGDGLYQEEVVSGGVDLMPGDYVDLEFVDSVGSPAVFNARVTWRFRRYSNGVSIQPVGDHVTGGSSPITNWDMAYEMEWSLIGTAFAEARTRIVAEFGYDSSDTIADGSGGDKLAESRSKYGERELTLSTTMFPLEPTQAQEIAQGLVLHHIEPRVTRRAVQSWWRAFSVKLDHIGRLVELPSGAVGYVQQRGYRDDLSNALAPAVESEFEVVVTEAAPSSEGLLAFDSGNLMRFDDGEIVEES